MSIEFHNKCSQFLQINQVVVYNQHQVHMSKKTDIFSYDYYTLHFYDNWMKRLFSNIYFKDNIINDKNIYNDFLKLCEYLSVTDSLCVETQIYNFFNNIVTKYANINSNNQFSGNYILNIIKDYIINNIDEQLTLDDISNHVGYTKEYIVRVFKKEYGLSPHAFLMNEKVNKAKNILQNPSDVNLATLASDIGFYDQSHFSKFFKKSFALPPSKYQKSILYKT